MHRKRTPANWSTVSGFRLKAVLQTVRSTGFGRQPFITENESRARLPLPITWIIKADAD